MFISKHPSPRTELDIQEHSRLMLVHWVQSNCPIYEGIGLQEKLKHITSTKTDTD